MEKTFQLIVFAILMVSFGVECAKHGQPKTGEHNAYSSLAALILVLFLYWGAGMFRWVF